MKIVERLFEKLRLKLLLRDEYESLALRRHFATRYNIEIGLHSYGCFDRWRIPPKSRIGRYCSFAKSARILDANHPIEALSTHPYIYERHFGVVKTDLIDPSPIVVEDDVWLSHNVIVTPGCKHIGRGAVIGAGAVVTRDVPAYAIMAGNPARLVRMRFVPETIAAIEASRWWLLDRRELAALVAAQPEAIYHPSAKTLTRLQSDTTL